MCSSYSPQSSEKYAMDLPSGDHTGDRSCAPTVLVRLRESPFSAGTVTISPRNSNTALAPVGEIEAFRMYREPFTYRARVSTRSADTPIVSLVVRDDLG